MLEVLNDPWGFFAVSLVLGMFGTIIICGIVFSVQCHLNYLRRPKRGATRVSRSQYRRKRRREWLKEECTFTRSELIIICGCVILAFVSLILL